jgi:hypothetical protein
MTKIGNVFSEKIYLINYDEKKDALDNVPIDYRALYLLKAKKMFFWLIKLQDITLIKIGCSGFTANKGIGNQNGE